MADASDRTLPATPQRRAAARREGLMPPAAAPAWAAAAATIVLLAPAWLRATVPAAADVFRVTLPATRPPEPSTLLPAALLLPTVGLVLAAGTAGLAVRMLLDGATWQPGRAAPDLARIDPLRGLARIFSARSLLSSLGQAVGLALLVAVAVGAAAPLAAVAASTAALDDPWVLMAAACRPLSWLVAAAACVAVVQWLLARRRFEAAIRMTPQELADETRGTQAAAQVRLLHRQRAPGPVRRPAPAPPSALGSRSGR